MLNPARRYLTLRSLGAPAVLLSLAMQGVFRGFKDTRTPLYATGKQNLLYLLSFFFFCNSHFAFQGQFSNQHGISPFLGPKHHIS